MSQNRFWNLLAKKLSGEALPSDLEELEQLIKENPEWVYAAEHIENIWKLKDKEQGNVHDSEVAFALHLEQQKKNGLDFSNMDSPAEIGVLTNPPISHKTNRLRSFLIVGVVLSSIAGFVWIFSPGKSTDPAVWKSVSEVSTRLGNKSKLVLPDSSIVWLNAGSKLTYNEQFGINNRNTTLIGEAYFDVKKSTVPFIIHTNSIEIRVLGTVFNVKSYPNEKTETSLIRGMIEVSMDHRPGEKFILKPNEKLIVANEIDLIPSVAEKSKKEPMVILSGLTQTPDSTIIETSWVENKLIFQDESFEEMSKKMERWYNVTIEIPDQKIAKMRVTGTFENETVKQALDALQIAFKFNYSIQQNKITITH